MRYANGVPSFAVTVIETPTFARSSKGVLTEEEIAELKLTLETNPNAGVVLKGLEGCRKLRLGAQGRGKRGGARVVYLVVSARGRIYLLLAYSKAGQKDLSKQQRLMLSQAAKKVKSQ